MKATGPCSCFGLSNTYLRPTTCPGMEAQPGLCFHGGDLPKGRAASPKVATPMGNPLALLPKVNAPEFHSGQAASTETRPSHVVGSLREEINSMGEQNETQWGNKMNKRCFRGGLALNSYDQGEGGKIALSAREQNAIRPNAIPNSTPVSPELSTLWHPP